MREEEQTAQGKTSFKSYIFEQEKIKRVKLKIARGLRKALGTRVTEEEKYRSIF
jgi:hypothetical protein